MNKFLFSQLTIMANNVVPFLVFLCNFHSFSQIKNGNINTNNYTEIKTTIPISASVYKFEKNVCVISFNNEKYHLVDTMGNIINKEPFEYINYNNSDNYFFARKNNHLGVINDKSEEILPFIYSDYFMESDLAKIPVFDFSLCMVKNSENKFGFVNKKGKIIIPMIYERVEGQKWNEGSIVMQQNNKKGIIDTLGNIIIPFEYKILTAINSGYALGQDQNDKIYILNKNGLKKITSYKAINCTYSRLTGFNDGLACVQNSDNFWGFVNTKGEEIVKCQFHAVADFYNGKARVSKIRLNGFDYDWGYIDTKGNLITPIKYQQVDDFSNNIAMVRIENPEKHYLYYNYIDANGKEINNYEYGNANSMINGIARVQKSTFKEMNGEYVITGRDIFLTESGTEIEFNKNYSLQQLNFSDNLIAADSSFFVGFLNKNGKVEIPFIYEFAYEFNNNYAWVRKPNDKYWYILKRKLKT